MMLTIDHDNGGATPPAHPEPNHVPSRSGGARASLGSSSGGSGSGSGSSSGSGEGNGAVITNSDVIVQDGINHSAAPSGVYGSALQEPTGRGSGGGSGEIPVPATELQGQHWEPLFMVLALLCAWCADHVASRVTASLVESPAISSLVRDVCVQASFAVPVGALHGLHRWGVIDEATRAHIAGVMPTWHTAWSVFSIRDPRHAGDPGDGSGGGGETLPGGGDGGGGRRGGMFWRVLFCWVDQVGLAIVSYCLARLVGEDSPSVSSMLRDWCKPVEQLLVTALLCAFYHGGLVDRAIVEDIAARLPGWFNGA